MKRMKTHIRTMERRLKLWGAKLDGIAIVAEESGSAMNLDYQHRFSDLKNKYHAALMNLDEMGVGGIENWETFSVDLDKSWKEFEASFMALTN